MKKLVLSIATLLILTSMIMAQTGDMIIGKYHLPNQLDIEIFKLEGKYYGKIIGLDGFNDGQQKDIHSPNESEQDEPLLGKVIINNLAYDQEENEWVDGTMYGPEKGLVFNLRISEIRQNEIVVIATKYFFRKTLTWEKF